MLAELLVAAWTKTEAMLLAARAGDWEILLGSEAERRTILAPWMAAPSAPKSGWPAPLARQIVAADAEIERLVRERLRALEDLLGEAALRRRAERAYTAP